MEAKIQKTGRDLDFTGREIMHGVCVETFYTGLKKRGGRVRTEESSYEGFHWVQCFVLDGNECVGVSEEFIVNIK